MDDYNDVTSDYRCDDLPPEDDADYPEDNWDDVDADADTLASAGYGTDEDYGYYGDEDYDGWCDE